MKKKIGMQVLTINVGVKIVGYSNDNEQKKIVNEILKYHSLYICSEKKTYTA